jgi:exonuclease I
MAVVDFITALYQAQDPNLKELLQDPALFDIYFKTRSKNDYQKMLDINKWWVSDEPVLAASSMFCFCFEYLKLKG